MANLLWPQYYAYGVGLSSVTSPIYVRGYVSGAFCNSNRHPVVGRLNIGRQLRIELLVIEIGVQIGQDGAPRLEAADPLQCIVEREMARVRPIAQRVDDPDVEAGQRRGAFRRHAGQVAGIGEVAEAKTERSDVAVLLQDG